jgi:hypothetical protein
MKMRQALISIARIAVSPYPRYSESMPLFSHQVFMPAAPITMKILDTDVSYFPIRSHELGSPKTMKTEPPSVSERPARADA